jgi:hypothetical protein
MKNKLIGKAATKVREDFSLIENTRKLNALFHKSRGEPQNLQKLER